MSEAPADDRECIEQQIEELRNQVAELERQMTTSGDRWTRPVHYPDYDAASGFFLGMVGALASLAFNIVGSLLVGLHPLRLLQVYLTFPMGEKALAMGFDSQTSMVALAVAACLYVATGMVLGAPFQMLMVRALPNGALWQRLGLATVVGLLLWAINFYLILSWLQPVLFGGDWITDPQYLPPWVGAATHVVFAWTMAAISGWGRHSTESLEPTEGQPA